MALYLIVSLNTIPNSDQSVDAAVQAKIPKEDAHQIESGKWLINSNAVTSKEVSDALGISEGPTYFLTPVRGYFGRAKGDTWEWLAAKSTAKPNVTITA
jgi:hypothetical protein